jgi:hypothetical protein
VAIVSENLHNNSIIEAFIKYFTAKYETLAVGEWVIRKQANVEDGAEARYITLGGARSAVVAY